MNDPITSSLLGLPGLAPGAGASTSPTAAAGAPDQLLQEDFLKLMLTQLQSQDPFQPMESGEFLSQFAEFGTVSGIQDLQKSFNGLTTSLQSLQALQASSLVGRDVLVAGNAAVLRPDDPIDGAVQVDATGVRNIVVSYLDSSGQLVHQQAVTADADGRAEFSWNGVTGEGELAPPGRYTITAQGVVNGEPSALKTLVRTGVESVTLGQGGLGLTLNLTGVGAVAASDIIEIM